MPQQKQKNPRVPKKKALHSRVGDPTLGPLLFGPSRNLGGLSAAAAAAAANDQQAKEPLPHEHNRGKLIEPTSKTPTSRPRPLRYLLLLEAAEKERRANAKNFTFNEFVT